MQIEKKTIIDDLLERVNSSPFLLVADYNGLKVRQFEELRKRLRAVGSRIYVTKNSYVKRLIKETDLPEDLAGALSGQTAIITGQDDICAAAKVLKNFEKEFKKPQVRQGALDGKLLTESDVKQLADLPSKEQLIGQLLGLLQAPATNLARLLNEPGSRVARVLQANVDKG